jgi:hypothetical protein
VNLHVLGISHLRCAGTKLFRENPKFHREITTIIVYVVHQLDWRIKGQVRSSVIGELVITHKTPQFDIYQIKNQQHKHVIAVFLSLVFS